jgi:hypothetical protein
MAEALKFPSPSYSPFAPWPVDLMSTVDRSLRAHTPANRYLDNAFWYQERWGGAPPKTAEDAFNRLSAEWQNVLREVHTRASLTGLWSFVRYIGNIWSEGLSFICLSKGALRGWLTNSTAFCRDEWLMSALHQGDGPTQTWREIVDGRPGLHISIPGRPGGSDELDQAECSMHIDPHQIVLSRELFNPMCRYSPVAIAGHVSDLGGSAPHPFFMRP